MNNYELASFVSGEGRVFFQLKDKLTGEVVAGAFFRLADYQQFYGGLEIVLRELISKGLAEPLAHELEQVPDPATFS